MIDIISVVKGHYLAGKEHCDNHNLPHKTTWLQAVLVTINDLFHYKTITLNGSYVVYNVTDKKTIGIRVAEITSIYVPKSQRGKGIASVLLDLIPEKTVISDRGNYEEVGRLVLCRKNDT
ncbi:MAG: hypothetical protein DRH37_07330 [Deltaproteobacteria bacterium]|nr:MAG: hypothetical protein DRH37_07330 [Deltaproteobacteria bacterium]